MTPKFMLLGILLASSAEAESLNYILDQMVDAYGGEASLRGANRMVQEWDLVALMGNRRGTDRRSVFLPGRLKVELTYPHKKEVRLLNGDTGTVIFGDSGPVPAQVPQKDAMRLQLMRLYSPLVLREQIERLEHAAYEGHVVLTLYEFGLRADYFVDTTTWHIDKVVGHMSVNGKEMTFVTEYSDFVSLDGILIYRRENKYAGNVNTAKLHLRNVLFDVDFDDTEFDVELPQGNVTIAKN